MDIGFAGGTLDLGHVGTRIETKQHGVGDHQGPLQMVGGGDHSQPLGTQLLEQGRGLHQVVDSVSSLIFDGDARFPNQQAIGPAELKAPGQFGFVDLQGRRLSQGQRELWKNSAEVVATGTWESARGDCAWLADISGLPVRLPSEAEWECACRAGSETEFCLGDEEAELWEYAWFRRNSGGKAHEVGDRLANAWGLHDLHGNVWEWCEDSWHEDYEGAAADGTAWTEGGTPHRVVHGGCFDGGAVRCRSAGRLSNGPGDGGQDLGFRPAFWPSDP